MLHPYFPKQVERQIKDLTVARKIDLARSLQICNDSARLTKRHPNIHLHEYKKLLLSYPKAARLAARMRVSRFSRQSFYARAIGRLRARRRLWRRGSQFLWRATRIFAQPFFKPYECLRASAVGSLRWNYLPGRRTSF